MRNRFVGVVAAVGLWVVLWVSMMPAGADSRTENGRFGVRLAYFEPSESFLDGKFVAGVDFWLSKRLRLGVERYTHTELYYDGYEKLELVPVMVTRILPSPREGVYYGLGITWFRLRLKGGGSFAYEPFSDEDVGFHFLAGRKAGATTFAEVRYSFGEIGDGEVGGLTVAYGLTL